MRGEKAIHQIGFSSGINNRDDKLRIRPDQLQDMRNMDVKDAGYLQVRAGFARWIASQAADAQIDGIYHFRPDDDQETWWIVCCNGQVYYSQGSSYTALTECTYTAGQICYFTQWQDRVFISNAADPVIEIFFDRPLLIYTDNSNTTLPNKLQLRDISNNNLPYGSYCSVGSGDSNLSYPKGLLMDYDQDILYVGDSGNNVVKRFNPRNGEYIDTIG